MARARYDADEAQTNLPALLERAHRGDVVTITKRGRPYAALVPIETLSRLQPRISPLALKGSGRGLWTPAVDGYSATDVNAQRDEWL